jgi:hypothetical protein
MVQIPLSILALATVVIALGPMLVVSPHRVCIGNSVGSISVEASSLYQDISEHRAQCEGSLGA